MKTLNIDRLFGGIVDFYTEDYYDDKGIRKPMPDPAALTKLVINGQMAGDGTKEGIWFSYYGPFDSEDVSKTTYSDSNYKIVPITF